MKKLILVLIGMSMLMAAEISAYGDFCSGWNNGYKAGYCYQKGYCLPPIPPLCPFPNLGEDSYDDGYNRGFLAGLSRSAY